ncbi:hypothetical protein PM082_015847 [Marasmius tenuissimus]|nr:hypothetical protein PM082_015847 [Marasmius tenuissimus]
MGQAILKLTMSTLGATLSRTSPRRSPLRTGASGTRLWVLQFPICQNNSLPGVHASKELTSRERSIGTTRSAS